MKHIYPLLFLTAAFALACGKTDPDTTPDTTDDNPAVVEDPVAPAADAEDDLATTTFDRTITITYSATEAAVEGDENGIESGFSAEQTVYSMSGTAGSWNALYGSGGFLAAFKAPSGLSSFAVTAPGLSSGYKGVSVAGESFCGGVLATTGITGGTSVTLGNYSAGGGGGGFQPGGGGGHRP